MTNGIDRLLGGSHLLQALGLDNQGLLAQLDQFQDQLGVLSELRDSFQMACGGMSPNMLASMLASGGIAAPGMMPGPNMGLCSCPGNYAPPQSFDLGAPQAGQSGVQNFMQRMQAAKFERFLQHHPFARQQFEMAIGGRILPDGLNDGRISVQPFTNGAFPAGGIGNDPFSAASGLLQQMGSANAYQQGMQQGMYQGMMLSALQNMFGSMFGGGGAGVNAMPGMSRTAGGGSPFVDWFGPPGNPQNAMGVGGGPAGANPFGGAGGPFMPGMAGPNQGQFGLTQNDGSDVSGVLNDPGLTVEDKVTLMIMLIMKQMDKDIEKQAQEINKLQQQQNKGGGGKGGGKGKGGGGGGGGDKSIDVETMKLKRLIDKRGQMFDMLRQIIDKYNQTAKGIIDSIGR